MGWARAGQEQGSNCWREPSTPVPTSLKAGISWVSCPGKEWKGFGKCHAALWLSSPRPLALVALGPSPRESLSQGLLRGPAPKEILIAFENPGFCWWHSWRLTFFWREVLLSNKAFSIWDSHFVLIPAACAVFKAGKEIVALGVQIGCAPVILSAEFWQEDKHCSWGYTLVKFLYGQGTIYLYTSFLP